MAVYALKIALMIALIAILVSIVRSIDEPMPMILQSELVDARAWTDRPPGGVTIPHTESLQSAIDSATDGATLYLEAGTYEGPVRIRRPVTLWGPRDAVIRTTEGGSTVDIRGNHVCLLGFSIDGSGERPDQKDSAIVIRGQNVKVAGIRIINALFGIVTEQCRHIELIGNEIIGSPEDSIGLRGDGIQLWETRDSIIQGNRLLHSRDILLQYSPNNRIIGNDCRFGRYGTHFMYSSDAIVRGNKYESNTVGIFVMYSRRIEVENNTLSNSNGFGGMGVGLKESSDIGIRRNQMVRDHVGIYFDNSPFDVQSVIRVEDNTIAFCESAITFLSSAHRCSFTGNTFMANQSQLRVEGTGDAQDAEWSDNSFDDYQGYDLNTDGIGDVPYELRSYSSQLTGQHPDLAFFRGSAPLAMIEAAGQMLPVLRPRSLLVDDRPRISSNPK